MSGNYSERLFELMAWAGRLVNDVLCALVRQVETSPPGSTVEGGACEVVLACDMIIAAPTPRSR